MGGRALELTPWAPGRPLGILGGTFDPIHTGHLAIAEMAREDLGLAGVLFVPAGLPPHKQDRPITPAGQRLAMVELAIADNPWFRASRIEMDRPGPSYAVDTVVELGARSRAEGREEPFFILSVEALLMLPTWRDPRGILERARICVVPRPGAGLPDREWLERTFAGLAERFVFLDGAHLGYSSSDIRARLAAGRSIRYLVPPAVEEYLLRHRPYGGGR